jgi:hypothetical protein
VICAKPCTTCREVFLAIAGGWSSAFQVHSKSSRRAKAASNGAQDFGRDCAEPCPRPAISLPRQWISGKMIKPRYRYGAITALYSKRAIPGRLPLNEKTGGCIGVSPERPLPCWSPLSCVRSLVVEPTLG